MLIIRPSQSLTKGVINANGRHIFYWVQTSDVHINVGMPPVMRINTELVLMPFPEVTEEVAGKMEIDTDLIKIEKKDGGDISDTSLI